MSEFGDIERSVLRFIKKVRLERKQRKMSYKIIEAIKDINYKDLAMRALWTFLQAFLAVLLLMSEQIVDLLFAGDWSGLQAVVIATLLGGVAAGLSALKTLIVETIKTIRDNSK